MRRALRGGHRVETFEVDVAATLSVLYSVEYTSNVKGSRRLVRMVDYQ